MPGGRRVVGDAPESRAGPADNASENKGLEADFSTLIKYIHVLNKRLL